MSNTDEASPVRGEVMRLYYVAFERHYSLTHYTKSWQIRRTKNDMDSEHGFRAEIDQMEKEYQGATVWIVNWKPLSA